MDSLKLRCSNCARMIAVELVDQHTRLCAAPPPPSPALVAYPSDFEDQMRHLFGSPAKLLMESLPESGSSPVDVGPADSLYRLSLPTGVHAGWVAKRGADFHLYESSQGDSKPRFLKSIRGRLLERAESIVSDLEEVAASTRAPEPELKLLCKVCEGYVPVSEVEAHAKTCAISFPVQVIRFEATEDAELPAKSKKNADPEVRTLADLPLTVLNALDKSEVPRELYEKHLDVLVNVLNFASKMRFRLSEKRRTPLRDAASTALAHTTPETIASLVRVALGNATTRERALAVAASRTLEDALQLLHTGAASRPDATAPAAPSEGQRILAAQKEVFDEASKLHDAMDMRAAKKLYTLEEMIGEGGFGKVYEAKCRDKKLLPVQVAIKVMVHKPDDVKARRTNLRELLYLTRLKHPNIVELYRAHLVDGNALWMVLEYMRGGTLREAALRTRFTEAEVAYAALCIGKAVAFIHSQGCVHRDIKSHNVMMTVEGCIKLIDFGLVADVKRGISTMRGILGTTYWIPPEMIRGEPHSYPADVWSMGICLMELCHGHPPHRDNKLRALFLAGAGVPPVFEDPCAWSDLCRSYFERMLVSEVTERAPADELAAHPWLQTACTQAEMKARLRQIFVTQALVTSGFM